MPGYQGEVAKGLAHFKRVHISRIFSSSPRLISKTLIAYAPKISYNLLK